MILYIYKKHKKFYICTIHKSVSRGRLMRKPDWREIRREWPSRTLASCPLRHAPNGCRLIRLALCPWEGRREDDISEGAGL